MWDDVISLVAGGAEGYEGQRRFDKQQDVQQERLEIQRLNSEIRAMVESLKETGRNERFGNVSGNVGAQQSGATERANIANTGANQRNDADNQTVERGQDLNDSHYWDTAGRQWSGLFMGDATRRRGQDVGAATTRRGQDVGASTTRRGQDLTNEDRDRGLNIDAYGRELQRQRDELDTSGLFGGGAAGRTIPTMNKWLEDNPAPASAAPPAAGTPPAARPAAPVPPRPAASTAGAPEVQATALVKQIRDLEAAGQDATAQRRQLAALRAGVKR